MSSSLAATGHRCSETGHHHSYPKANHCEFLDLTSDNAFHTNGYKAQDFCKSPNPPLSISSSLSVIVNTAQEYNRMFTYNINVSMDTSELVVLT